MFPSGASVGLVGISWDEPIIYLIPIPQSIV